MAMSRGRFIIRDGNDNRRSIKGKVEIVEPLKKSYTYADPLTDKRIKRSLNRINRRKK